MKLRVAVGGSCSGEIAAARGCSGCRPFCGLFWLRDERGFSWLSAFCPSAYAVVRPLKGVNLLIVAFFGGALAFVKFIFRGDDLIHQRVHIDVMDLFDKEAG